MAACVCVRTACAPDALLSCRRAAGSPHHFLIIAEALLKHWGADACNVNAVDEFGATALWHAVRHGGSIDAMELFKAAGADVQVPDGLPMSVAAALSDDVAALDALGDGVDLKARAGGLTPLEWACRAGRWRAADWLRNEDTSPLVDMWPALWHHATHEDRLDGSSDRRGDVLPVGKLPSRMLDEKKAHVVAMLLRAFGNAVADGRPLLHYVVQRSHAHRLEQALEAVARLSTCEQHAVLNAKDGCGATCLQAAIAAGNGDALDAIVASGTDVISDDTAERASKVFLNS